jgi:uncharacterized membrane protein (DUF4010 family)
MDFPELLSRFAVALGIGLLIGLERGWRTRETEPGRRAAGIRTFALSGLFGGIVGGLTLALGGATNAAGGIVVGLAVAAYATVITVFSLVENRAKQSYSATTAIAATATFALGIYALIGDIRGAAAVAVVTAGLLALRESLHAWLKNLAWPELRSGLTLLAMTFIVLPIVPDDPIGPYGGVNPREVWLIAILLAAVSFLGYAAVKYFDPRHGILLAGAAGGLASSTAVTVTNARRAAAGEGSPFLMAAGVSVASAIMFLRVAGLVAVLQPSLLLLIAPALITATVIAVGYAILRTYGAPAELGDGRGQPTFRNPFAFWSVIGFALFLAVIIVLGRALSEALGAAGAILGAVLAGLADVDAVTVSLVRLIPHTIESRQAALAILAAVASNTMSKIAIGAAIGRGRFAFEIGIASLLSLAGSALTLWATLAVAGS